jgi:hypothetical protein
MCMSCWEREDSPTIDTPAVRRAAAAVRALHDEFCTGGYLHIVVDDWNLEDGNLNFCERVLRADEDRIGTAGLALHGNCLRALRPLSEEERSSALALAEGFWQSCQPEAP